MPVIRGVGVVGGFVAVVLGTLSNKQVKMRKLLGRGATFDETVDDLDEELVEFLPGNRADFEMIEASYQ